MILDDKSVLVTGGTGSLGQVLVRRLLAGELGTPRKVIVLSRDEAKQHSMRLSYLHRRVTTDESIYSNFERILQFRIGDVRDYRDVVRSVQDADVVINAAALKQVPTCEYFPTQAVATNCDGAANIVAAVREHGRHVEAVVGVSTDKACKPVNVMGMTKAIQERIFISANLDVEATRFMVVRYGNVLASRGSVIPLFHEQIAAGGPVTITTAEMTRFLITLEEAVDMIFHALSSGRSGETVVPVTPSATVVNIAEALVGDRDVPIRITGIRPGEKLHEVLVSEEECHRTRLEGGYYVIGSMLPEVGHDGGRQHEVLKGEYSSGDDVLDAESTAALLERHHLLVGQSDLQVHGELLR